jgi:hypothetical protein
MEALIMHRLFGTGLILLALVFVAMGSNTALASDSPQKYGVEVRGGFGMYDMGDVKPGIESYQGTLRAAHIPSTLNEKDNGPAAGFSFLYRASRHTMWEVGYNALMDVNNKLDAPDSASAQILMHSSEFFFKGHIVATLTNRIQASIGGGISYYNAELQVQNNHTRAYYFDADGRAFGLVGSVGLECLLTKRLGLSLQGGGRVANATHFSYRDQTDMRTELSAVGGGRPMEVNLSGAYATLGLRFYFDPVTGTMDFTR